MRSRVHFFVLMWRAARSLRSAVCLHSSHQRRLVVVRRSQFAPSSEVATDETPVIFAPPPGEQDRSLAAPSQETTTDGDGVTTTPTRRKVKVLRPTGRLSQLPACMPVEDLLNRAKRKARMVPVDKSLHQPTARARKRATEQSDAIGQAISVPLRQLVKAYAPDEMEYRLHPFEMETARLTSNYRKQREGHLDLDDVVSEVNGVRKDVLERTKRACAEAKVARSIDAANKVVDDCFEDIEGRLKARSNAFQELKLLGRALRRLPTVSLKTPTVVLVGAPNVGKSTLVKTLSTGEPTIGNYPFTTRGVTMGHVYVDVDESADAYLENLLAGAVEDDPKLGLIDDGTQTKKYEKHVRKRLKGKDRRKKSQRFKPKAIGQILDTPGLLAREPGEARNEMEDLTLATMRYLPSAVVFVIDLSGAAGDDKSSPEAQLRVRNALRAQFPKRPWIDVVAKADLLDDPAQRFAPHHQDSAHEQDASSRTAVVAVDDAVALYSKPRVQPPPGAIYVSVKHGRGLDDLNAAVRHLLDKLQAVSTAYASSVVGRPS